MEQGWKSGYFWLRSNIIALTVFQFPATYYIYIYDRGIVSVLFTQQSGLSL